MKISKVLDVKTPTRGTDKSAGLDFYIPENTVGFWTSFEIKNPSINRDLSKGIILLKPHERVNIPSGIKVNIPKGYALIFYNKSGVSLKYGLDVGASVIDEDYQGIVHLSLVNTSNDNIILECGQKIIQGLLIKVSYDKVEEVKEEDLYKSVSKRGEGGFGSTGSK